MIKQHRIILVLSLCGMTNGFGVQVATATASSTATVASTILRDYSAPASALFNNMRTPAALIGGALVPLGILSAPRIEPNDTPITKFFKKANLLLSIASLLSEVIAITYSTVAINKIAELDTVMSEGVAQFIGDYHLLPWLGTNVHFLLGLFGFGLLAISKPYFLYGRNAGNVVACWATAAMMFCVSIVNKGISMGHGTIDNTGARFSDNLFSLTIKYAHLVWSYAQRGPLAYVACVLLGLSIVPLKSVIDDVLEEQKAKEM
mmetsp:Transcript_16048/g.19970  ORF Transcript_16048/g.19970 Transcript_16048/m.19970 type:complete len:262 (+) Transcript_16048:40-825(+)